MGVPRKVVPIVAGTLVLALGVTAVALAGFSPATTYPTLPGKDALDVVTGDFNGDGKTDLAVSNRAANRVSLLRGNGSGAFGVAHQHPAGAMPLGLLTGDWNGDGRTDLAAANQSNQGGVTIMLNNGHGFAKRTYPAGGGSSYVLAARLTADNRPDLVVSNLNVDTVSILRGKADGKFVKIGDLATGPDPFGIALADFNRDGKVDCGVITYPGTTQSQVQVFRGNGDGTFKAPLNTIVGEGANEMAVGRFNGDTIPDLAVADFSRDEVDILIGNGNGRFRPPKAFPAGESPAEVGLGDFTGDGKTDLAVSNSEGIGRVAVLPRLPGLDFGGPLKYPVGDAPYGIAVKRLNGDNRPDIATANFVGSTSVLLSN